MSSFFPEDPIVSGGKHPTGSALDAAMYAYGGVTANERENKFEAGAGFYKGENFDLWDGSVEAGVWNPDGGTGSQFGFRGEAQSIGAKASLGDLMELVTLGYADTMEGDQGGFSNFFEGEVHGPRAAGEISAGTDGITASAGAELAGGSVKFGGAEYDWFGGTEISVGGGIDGVGGNAGLSWSDDDGDGYREYGFSLGGELGIGIDGGIKTEAFGHIADWLMGTPAPDTGECEP
ncbi:MAG: hypothetical protein AB7T06_02800 [Kofleriaceae bacterium]